MCGISGYVASQQDVEFLDRALRLQNHRGPDDSGRWTDESRQACVGLAHNRLSILDLSSAAHQPMIDSDSGVALVYNGEIYNFASLRAELVTLGFQFQSSGDTEVVLKGYLAWGERLFSRLRGMFAIAVWDPREGILHLVRDHLGKKPIFWRFDKGAIYFASEIQALKTPESRVNAEAVADYFTYLYVPAPRTIWQNIHALPPAAHLKFQARSGEVKLSRYWALPGDGGVHESIDYEQAKTLIDAELRRAIRQRLVSDRPVGVFLSGGLDSSVISAIAAESKGEKLHTYSVSLNIPGYSYNESSYAELVAKHIGSTHEELQVDLPPPDGVFDLLVDGFGQPFGNPTAILSYLLTKEARSRMVVGLIGDGADEIFLGYPRYRYANLAKQIRGLTGGLLGGPAKWLASRINERTDGSHLRRRLKLFASTFNDDNAIYEWASYFHYGWRDRLLKKGGASEFAFFKEVERAYEPAPDEAVRASRLDLETFVPCNLLENADRMGMANSFELRAPYLDADLVTAVMALPRRYRLDNKTTKKILRDIGRPLLPELTAARAKRGFNPPVGLWLREKLDLWLSQYVLNNRSELFEQWLNRAAIVKMAETHKSGKMDLSTELWGVFMFIAWYQREVESLTR